MKGMKKAVAVLLVLLVLFSFSACESAEEFVASVVFLGSILNSDDSVPKEEIIKFVEENIDKLRECEEKGDFSQFEGYGIVKKVYADDNYVDFYCGGKGLAAGYSYYCGFFYSPFNDYNALEQGDRYESEKICDKLYFYEAEYY